MRFAEGELQHGCAEPECAIQVHKIVLWTSRAKMIRIPLHRTTGGKYFFDTPDSRGGAERVWL